MVSGLKSKKITVRVPASKSILNRALLLAAFTEGDTLLRCGDICEDSEALLRCLSALGIQTKKRTDGLLVHGKRETKQESILHVGNAGTVARFLTAILAFRGGNYEFHASAQMRMRPMDILPLLHTLGVKIEYLQQEEHFPFRMSSDGISAESAEIDTSVSTQYASGLLLAAALSSKPFRLILRGGRQDGSYINMTAALITAFGGNAQPLTTEKGFSVTPIYSAPSHFTVEPDVSGACYFFALSLLCNACVLVEGVHAHSLQGDMRFLRLLQQKGLKIKETSDGIIADGENIPFYNGFDEDMQDYSDQTMTVAVLAAFASSPSILRGISHIKAQECDRVNAIIKNLNALGARAFTNGEDIFIEPNGTHPCKIKTFGDHRVAMSFALAGMKTGNVEIDDPDCCRKTFPDFFKIIKEITV